MESPVSLRPLSCFFWHQWKRQARERGTQCAEPRFDNIHLPRMIGLGKHWQRSNSVPYALWTQSQRSHNLCTFEDAEHWNSCPILCIGDAQAFAFPSGHGTAAFHLASFPGGFTPKPSFGRGGAHGVPCLPRKGLFLECCA